MKCFPSIVLLNFGAEARLKLYLPYARKAMPCSCSKWGNYSICLKRYKMRKMPPGVAKTVISVDNIRIGGVKCEYNNTFIAHIIALRWVGVTTE